MLRDMRIFGLAIAAVLGLAVAGANADIVQDQAFTFNGVMPTPASPFEFDQYDGSDGILIAVVLEILDGDITSSASVQNASGAAADYTLNILGSVDASGPAGLLVIATATGGSDTVNIADGDTQPLGPIAGTFADSDSSSDAGVLAVYTGPGTVDVDLTIGANGSISGPDFLASTSTEGDGIVRLTYVTAEIPEPASMALVGLGAVALVARRRRKA